MKKIIIALMLLFTINISAQNTDANVMSRFNTTTTVLNSAGVFTGTAEILRGYNSVSVTIRADQSGTYKLLFGNTSTITTATAVKTYSFNYTANDTLHTKSVPVGAPYFKIVFTSSGVVAQTKFYLITMLNKGYALPITSTGKLDIDGTVTATVSGVSTETTLALLKNELAPATKFYGKIDTVSVSVDTTTVSGTWAEGEIIASDSCEVSIVGAFTTGQTFIITETTAVKIPKWSIATSSKLYIKRYGNVGTVTFRLRLSSY